MYSKIFRYLDNFFPPEITNKIMLMGIRTPDANIINGEIKDQNYTFWEFLEDMFGLYGIYDAIKSKHLLRMKFCLQLHSQDHNTSNARERERVTAMGGVIKDNRVGGVLIPTRCQNVDRLNFMTSALL